MPEEIIPGFAGTTTADPGIAPVQSELSSILDGFVLDTGVGQIGQETALAIQQGDALGAARSLTRPFSIPHVPRWLGPGMNTAAKTIGGFYNDPNYNPLRDEDLTGLPPELVEDIGRAGTPEEFQRITKMYQVNEARRERLGYNQHEMARFLGNMADPVNFIPIPIALGRGFWAGMKAAAPATGFSVGGSELIRHDLDPTSTMEETAINIGAGTMFGAGFAGLAGGIPRWMAKGAINRAHEKYLELNQRYDALTEDAAEALSRRSFADRGVSRETFEADIAPHLPEGASYEAFIRGEVGDGLPGEAIRLQGASRAAGEPGTRHIIVENDESVLKGLMPDKEARKLASEAEGSHIALTDRLDGKGWMMTASDDMPTLTALMNRIELRRVENFNSRQAFEFGRTPEADLFPGRPDGASDAEALKAYMDEQIGKLHKDRDGFFIHREDTGEEMLSRARERVDRERLDAEEVLNEIQADIDALSAKKADLESRAAGHKHKATASRLRNQAAALEPEIKALQGKKGMAYERLQDVQDRIARAEAENDIDLFDIKPTNTGLEDLMGKGAQFPFYILKKTRLRDLAPDLAAEWQQLASDIAGTPGLFMTGNARGIRTRPSVEMYAKFWHGALRQTKEKADAAYLEYAGYKGEATPGKMYWQNASERLQKFLSERKTLRKRKDAPGASSQEDQVMSYDDFRSEVSKAIIANGKHPNPHVEKAARAHHELLDKMGAEAEALNMFHTKDNLAKRVEILKARINKAEQKGATQRRIDSLMSELMDTEAMLKSMEDIDLPSKDNWFFHRVWVPQKIGANEEGLKDLLRAWFRNPDGNKTIINGRVVKFSDDPIQIEARVEEALVTLKREANFGDSLGLMNTGDVLERTIKRRNDLQVELDELAPRVNESPEVKQRLEVLKARIDMLDNRIAQGSAKTPGGPNALMTRRLNIPNDFSDGKTSILEFIETDVDTVMAHYVGRMAPAIEMARKFGDTRMSGHLDEMLDRLAVRAEEVANTDQAKAAEILAERDRLQTAAHDLRDKVLGVFGIPEDPDALSHRSVRMLMAFNTLTAMGRAWLTALPDVGNTLGVHVFAGMFGDATGGVNGVPALRGFFKLLKKGTDEWQLAANEVLMAGEAMEIMNAARFSQITEVPLDAYSGSGWLGKLEEKVYGQQSPFFLLNLLAPWTDHAKKFAGTIAQSRMIEDSLLLVEGKLPAKRTEELARLGIDEVTARRFAEQWQFAGGQKGRDLFLANTEAWADQQAVREFRAILSQEVNSMVVTPGAADKPNILSKDWAKVMGQYHGFSMSATQRIMMANLQRNDMRAVSAVGSMIGLAWIVDSYKRPDYIEMDIEDQLYRAVEMSGVTGIFSDLNQAIEKATGGDLGMRSMMGLQSMERDPNWATKMGAVGAVPSQWMTLLYPFVSDDADAKDLTRGIRYMIPYNNLWVWNNMTNRLQRSATGAIEEFEEE